MSTSLLQAVLDEAAKILAALDSEPLPEGKFELAKTAQALGELAATLAANGFTG